VSRSAVYELRARPTAQAFRMAWDSALDLGIRALTDACYARAIEGEAVPRYYRGELIGEHRRFDNRLAMFLLRYRDPLRYAASLDQMVYSGHPERAGVAFAKARHRLLDEAHGETPAHDEQAGAPPFEAEPIAVVNDREADEALAASDAPVRGSPDRRARIMALRRERFRREQAQADADWKDWSRDVASMLSGLRGEGDDEGDDEAGESEGAETPDRGEPPAPVRAEPVEAPSFLHVRGEKGSPSTGSGRTDHSCV
jgi:hypothetical protein